MSLNEVYETIANHVRSASIGVVGGRVLIGGVAFFDSETLEREKSFTLDCVILPVQPFKQTFCNRVERYILDIKYIATGKQFLDNIHNTNITGILNAHDLDVVIDGMKVYQYPRVTQWNVLSTTKEAVISIYFQVEKEEKHVKN